MSSSSLYSQDSFIPESERPQNMASIKPHSQQQLASHPPYHLASPNCATNASAMTVKPLCPSESGVGNAVIDPQTQTAAPRPSRLLALPVELRRRILFFVLPYSRSDDKYGTLWQLGDTSVLRTCRQFHDEGTSVLYLSNSFTIIVQQRCSPAAVRSVSSAWDPALTNGLPMWFYHSRVDGSVAMLYFHEPFPMRPEDVWLIRRWNIHIAEMDDYSGDGTPHAVKMGLLLQDRVLGLVDRILQGRQDLKILRVKWQGGYDTAANSNLEQYRKTLLEPLADKAMAIEEEFHPADKPCEFEGQH